MGTTATSSRKASSSKNKTKSKIPSIIIIQTNIWAMPQVVLEILLQSTRSLDLREDKTDRGGASEGKLEEGPNSLTVLGQDKLMDFQQ
jgi:hypothetical protein